MSNMYEDPIYDEVGTSYDSNIPSEVQDHDYYSDNVDEYHQVLEYSDEVRPIVHDWKRDNFFGSKKLQRIISSEFLVDIRISVALVDQNHEHMLMSSLLLIPNVHEFLEHTTKKHVHLENPPSSSRTLSSMKNLEDNFTFGDQVINDKSQKVKLGKTTMESEVESMVNWSYPTSFFICSFH
ncbi:hypothetical protein Tco_0914466 [Tanacetum coccineum]